MDNHPSAGQVVDFHYEPSFIVLSYIISSIGCWTALELLQRRTSIHGLYNWYLLLAASLTMSSVGIWSMHYIGICAIVMADGDKGLRIVYNGGFTAGSLLMPIAIIAGAFFVFSISKVSILRTLIGGFLVGLGICGMHYLGQVSIFNYKAVYAAANIVGAAIIAVAASTVALGLFFYLNSNWTNNWLKRLACAKLLAAAVSGMHWVASVGTTYHYKIPSNAGSAVLSRKDTVIIVCSLALGCCIVLMSFALLGQRSKKQSATRAREVILASATFDTEDRLMVNPDGLLPCEKITSSYREDAFDKPFGVGHPVFCWLFRLSHCWTSIHEFFPAMYDNVKTATESKTSVMNADFGLSNGNDHYATFFKQLFCVAAGNLAATFHDTIDNMGVLFGHICITGTVTKDNVLKRLAKKVFSRIRRRSPSNLGQGEQGDGSDDVLGQGQLLFLVRRIGKSEAGRLAAIGYRFAPIAHVVDHLAESFEVTSRELLPRLEQMRGIAGKEMLLEAGVHVACFALRPVFRRGFDVLVRKDAKNLLPSIRLPIEKLSADQFNLLRRCDGMTVANCLVKMRRISTPSSTQEEETFGTMFFDALNKLRIQLKDSFFDEARLMARALIAPCPQVSIYQRLEYATIIAFRTITDVHGLGNVDRRFEYIPCPFFLTEQKVYLGFSDNDQFGKEVREGFGGQVRRADSACGTMFSVRLSPPPSGNGNRSTRYRASERLTRSRKFPFIGRAGRQTPASDYSSTRHLVHMPSRSTRLGTANTSIDDVYRANTPDIEMVMLNASQGPSGDTKNFAEELVASTVNDRKKLRKNNAGPSRYLSNY